MNHANRIIWRWAERDFGFRFVSGSGRQTAEYYQAELPAQYYHVPGSQRKLAKARIEELDLLMKPPIAPTVVANPWHDYGNHDCQQITGPNYEPCLNYAGCLSIEEIKLRETNGVNRAREFIAELARRQEPAAITLDLIRRVHKEAFEDIYPWAGEWRTVSLHKGEGATKWPLPITGMDPVMQDFERQVLSRTPFLSNDDEAVCAFTAEFLGEYIACHPFREGNGRSAFILADLVLLQNDLLPLKEYNQTRDELRYLAACEDARVKKDYTAITALVAEWQADAQAAFGQPDIERT